MLCSSCLSQEFCSILTLFVTGVADEAFPEGAIVLLVLVALIFVKLWRWIPAVGGVFALFLTVVGVFASPGFVSRLTHPGETDAFIGTTIQVIGLLITLIFAVRFVLENIRARV